MRKIYFLFLLLLLLGSRQQLQAQLKGFSIGPYGEAAFPIGDFKQNFTLGGGAGATADVKLIKKFSATGSVGYLYFRGDKTGNKNGGYKVPDMAAIPIRVGLKYRMIPLLYLKMEAGSATYTGNNYEGSAFILSPGIGLRVLGFDFQAKYEAWMNNGASSFFGLRAGWNF